MSLIDMHFMGIDFTTINLMEISWVIWLGIGLLVWLAYDLFSGAVYLHREIERTTEPALYWFSMLIWAAVAASCFIYE